MTHQQQKCLNSYFLRWARRWASGMLIVKLHNWSDRKADGSDAQSVVDKINAIGMEIPDVTVFAFLPPLIYGYGVSSGFEINLQDMAGGRAV